jgi:8-oxo-dGTP pyrophosphatase MutT (NUDIX family)
VDRDELIAVLDKAGIPYDRWGTGKARTVEHLLEELETGKSALLELGGFLQRVVRVVTAHIFYHPEGQSGVYLLLKENRQVFSDGRVRWRNYDCSLNGRVGPGESDIAAIYRSVQEELGIDSSSLTFSPRDEETRNAAEGDSYPGLPTKYRIFRYETILPTELFKPESYVECKPDVTTYFNWWVQ